MIWALIAAAGSGSRAGQGMNKVLVPVGGVPVLVRTLRAFDKAASVDACVLVCAPGEEAILQSLVTAYGIQKVKKIVPGGCERGDSVAKGLAAIKGQCTHVLIHDGARPFITSEAIDGCSAAVLKKNAIVAGAMSVDTVKRVEKDGLVAETLDRSALFCAQTPQAFAYDLIDHAYAQAQKEGRRYTDDAAVAEAAGYKVYAHILPCANQKLTHPGDFSAAQKLLAARPRTGFGYDVHRLVEERKLILCGVEVDAPLGLLGHSDADVALHALMDALLAAAGMGDIGLHFPDTDDAYKGISSRKLLQIVMEKLHMAGYAFGNAGVTIVAQKPKLAPYRQIMRQTVAAAIGCAPEDVNVQFTTTEKLGFTGRGEGIAAYATATIFAQA